MADAILDKSEGGVKDAKGEDGSSSITKSRKPEGPFKLFLMDFDISGTNKSLYPAVIKQYRGARGDKLAKNATAADYIPARYAIGKARLYIIQALGLPQISKAEAAEFTPLRRGKYERTVLNLPAGQRDPETTAVIIETGKPVKIGISGVIAQTGVEGQTQNVAIVGPVQLRIPTLVSIRQFVAWISSAKGPPDKSKLSHVLLAGGRQIPIAGGADQPTALIDGPK